MFWCLLYYCSWPCFFQQPLGLGATTSFPWLLSPIRALNSKPLFHKCHEPIVCPGVSVQGCSLSNYLTQRERPKNEVQDTELGFTSASSPFAGWACFHHSFHLPRCSPISQPGCRPGGERATDLYPYRALALQEGHQHPRIQTLSTWGLQTYRILFSARAYSGILNSTKATHVIWPLSLMS